MFAAGIFKILFHSFMTFYIEMIPRIIERLLVIHDNILELQT